MVYENHYGGFAYLDESIIEKGLYIVRAFEDVDDEGEIIFAGNFQDAFNEMLEHGYRYALA